MAVQGEERNYHQKFNFGVEIDGLEVAWFMKAGPLKQTVSVIVTPEGGNMTDEETPGKTKFENLTLSLGVTNNMEFANWMKEVCDASRNRGEPAGRYKRNMSIVQYDRDNSPMKRYSLFRAWPFERTAGDWDAANDTEVNVEEVVLRYRYMIEEVL